MTAPVTAAMALTAAIIVASIIVVSCSGILILLREKEQGAYCCVHGGANGTER
jgi:hypothetical protein